MLAVEWIEGDHVALVAGVEQAFDDLRMLDQGEGLPTNLQAQGGSNSYSVGHLPCFTLLDDILGNHGAQGVREADNRQLGFKHWRYDRVDFPTYGPALEIDPHIVQNTFNHVTIETREAIQCLYNREHPGPVR